MLEKLNKLEKKFGKYAIKNLICYILGAYVIGYILYMAKPEWYEYIILYPSLVMKGQVWRLFTWVLTIPQSVGIFLIFMFIFYYFIGKTLERYMGAFKYNIYILSGWLFTTLGALIYYWITGSNAIAMCISTNYMNLTSFLAFALIFPDTRVLLFGIIPIKMKILAWIDAGYLGLQVISGLVISLAPQSIVSEALSMYTGTAMTPFEVILMKESSAALVVTILISFLNFLLFFFGNMKKRKDSEKRRKEFESRMNQGRQAQQNQNRSGYEQNSFRRQNSYNGRPDAGQTGANTAQKTGQPRYRADNSSVLIHKCSICGRTNITNPELMFRYCSKCSGNHEYCQDHLFTHEHVK